MSSETLNVVLVLHCHQPVGNFDAVFAWNCDHCYEPLLAELAGRPNVRVCLHFSGPLLEWMEAHRPQTSFALRHMVERGNVELLGGGLYEPILAALSERDRVGQTRRMAAVLQERFGVRPRGAWLAERVWEQGLVSSLAAAGVEYVCLDDFHFRCAGLKEEALDGYYVTEHAGRTLAVFPMREDLRFAIPWKSPEEVVERLRALAVPGGDAVAVYADDGEKFGGWPGTFAHVHERGWLRRFLDLLEADADCLRLGTLGELRDRLEPRGTVYLPDGSYREMTEWALPAEAQEAYGNLRATLEHDGIDPRVGRFLKGGTWRGFLAKYPEAAAMHAKMQHVSGKVAAMEEGTPDAERAQTALYRGQCNCAYWHGVFGGVYLPHLRASVYENLLEAEAIADAVAHEGRAWAEARVVDIDLDGREDVVLATDAVWLAADPARGGMLMECDARTARVNLLAGMTRRPESYHRDARVEAPDLRPLLQYDTYRRGALLDHFLAPEAAESDPDDAARFEWGDFVAEPYTAMVVETGPDRAAARLVRDGVVQQRGMRLRVSVTKELRVTAGSGDVQVAYGIANASNALLETLFAVEFGFALLAGDGPDRYIEVEGRRLGLGSPTAWTGETDALTVADTWRKLRCTLRADTPMRFGSYPLFTASRSQDGYETTYQSTVVLAALPLRLDPGARTDLTLTLETTARE